MNNSVAALGFRAVRFSERLPHAHWPQVQRFHAELQLACYPSCPFRTGEFRERAASAATYVQGKEAIGLAAGANAESGPLLSTPPPNCPTLRTGRRGISSPVCNAALEVPAENSGDRCGSDATASSGAMFKAAASAVPDWLRLHERRRFWWA
eukprot:scaffold245_cov256-Pinguiococcus_pyrenoidosus.AAC.34